MAQLRFDGLLPKTSLILIGLFGIAILVMAGQGIWRMAGLMTLLLFISAGTTIALLRKVTLPLRQFLDNTERKRSADELDRFFNHTPNIMLVAGFDGYIKRANAAALDLGGWTFIDEMKAEPFLNYFHPDDRESVVAVIQQLLTGSLIQTFEARSRYHVDSYRWFSWSAAAYPDWQVIFATAQDITERKLAEEDRQRLVSLVENSTDFIALATLSEEVFYVNAAGRDLVELDPSRQTPTSIYDYYTQSGQRVMHDVVLPAVKTTGHWRGEIEFRNFRTDRPKATDSSVFLIRQPKSGEPLCLATVTRDITARKQAEQQLHQAKTAAEAANRAKSEFLANMSHEIRTPMNGIIGLTGLALDTELVPEQRQYLEGVMLSAESLLKLINSILDFSKIEAGKLELERTDFDLRETLENAVKTLAQRAFEKQLELRYEVRPDVPDALIGDPARLWQVIINLVGNALKFTQKGEITVLVELESQDESAATLRFTVSDTGVGIPVDKQGKLFQPFVQADNSTTRKYGGTGLGLVISARLVEMMGGRAWFESEEGRGSQFHFTARFDRQPAHAAKDVRPHPVDAVLGAIETARGLARQQAVTNRESAPAKSVEPMRHPLHILVAEDNAVNQLLAKRTLEKAGHSVVVANNGEQAVAALGSDTFDLVLMDIQMPVMDGFQATARIRELEIASGKHQQIVAMTAHALKGDHERCLAAGMDGYVTKPIRTSELFAAIATAVKDN